MATRDELLANIREKYPVYKDVPDDELANGISAKYPQYAPILTSNAPARVPNAKTPQQGIATGGSILGDIGAILPTPSEINSEFYNGMDNGIYIGGDNVLGRTLGTLLGTARGGVGLLKPIGKALQPYTNAAQATGSAFGGDLNASLQALGGKVPVTSALDIPEVNTGSVNLDTLINGATGTANEAVIRQPFSPVGLTPAALGEIAPAFRSVGTGLVDAAKEFPGNVRNAAKSVKSSVRSSAPIDPEAVAAAQKKVQDLEYLREQNRINKTKTAEVKSAEDLIFQEEIARAKAEAEALGAQALRANQDLGSQIDALNQQAEQAPIYAEDIRGKLPQPQEPSQLRKTVQSGIDEAIKKEKPLENADYSEVDSSQPPPKDQLRLVGSNQEAVAQEILSDKKSGYSADFKRDLKSRVSESLPGEKVDPLSNMSSQVRDIYENLPEAQRQDFLLQAGVDLSKTQPRTYNWSELQARYRGLNGAIREASDKGSSDLPALLKLKEAVIADMESYASASGAETKALFDQANARFSANKAKFGDVANLALSTPETIVSNIVGPNKVEVINSLKKVLTPEIFDQVKSQYADQLMSPSKNVPFDPDHFMKQFDKISDETLKSVFGDDGFAQLQKINELSKSASKAVDLKTQLDEFNSKAQKAVDDYAKAKTKAEEKAVVDGARAEAEAAIDAIKDEKFKRDIEKAKADLQKAQTPEKIRLITRVLYGIISASLASVGGVAPAIAAGVAAAAFGRVVHKGVKSSVGTGLDALIRGKK